MFLISQRSQKSFWRISLFKYTAISSSTGPLDPHARPEGMCLFAPRGAMLSREKVLERSGVQNTFGDALWAGAEPTLIDQVRISWATPAIVRMPQTKRPSCSK